jgi:hypothetical protein
VYIIYVCTGVVKGYFRQYTYLMDKPKRKGGRPPKPAKDRASARVDFRCTAAEKAAYRRKAGAKGISAWLKKLADDA